MIPKAGSAYTYGYVVLGEGVGWFIGWDLLLEYTAIVAVVGIGISGYFGFLVEQLGLNLPEWMLGAPGSDPEQPGRVVDLFALLLCLLIAFILTQAYATLRAWRACWSGSRSVSSSSSSGSACST